MTFEPKTALQKAQAALAHFFLGLMKADGNISTAETGKIDILYGKFKGQLPGDPDHNRTIFKKLHREPGLEAWTPSMHLDAGIGYWEEYYSSGLADEGNLEALFLMIEVLADVDEIMDEEVDYIQTLQKRIAEKFNYEAEIDIDV